MTTSIEKIIKWEIIHRCNQNRPKINQTVRAGNFLFVMLKKRVLNFIKLINFFVNLITKNT